MREEIKKAHSKAFKKADFSVDVEYLLELVSQYLNKEKSPEEIADELSKKYKKEADVYLKCFGHSLEDQYIGKGIDWLLSKNEVLNDKDFSRLLKKKAKQVSKEVSKFLKGKTSEEELLNFMLNDVIKPISMDALRLYDINIEDAKLLINLWQSESYAMLDYAATCEVYKYLMELLNEAALIHEERIEIEKRCKEQEKAILEYRNNIEQIVSDYLFNNSESFKQGLLEMDEAILENDADGYIHGNNVIQEALGYSSQFSNQEEFEDLMDSDFDFIL